MQETRLLARFVRETRYEDFPSGLVDEFKAFVLDAFAAAFIGPLQPWSRRVLELVKRLGGREEASVFDQPWRTDISRAALANGALIAAFECHPLTGTHASGTVLPAVMAVCEREHLEGRAFLTALILGAEVSARLARTAAGLESERGFHNPGVLGPVAAAAAVGRLYDFEEDALVSALGIAGSHSAGLLEFAWEGADTKRLHEGRASQLGLESALLAGSGFSGPATVLEGRYGFFNAFSMPADLTKLTTGLGEEWAVRPPSHKAYAAHATHQAVIQAIEDYKRGNGLDPSRVSRVTIHAGKRMLEDRYTVRSPATLMGAQYSLPFTTAVALTRDMSDPLTYDEGVLKDPLVRGLAQRIELRPSESPAPLPRVEIDVGGATQELAVRAAKGSAGDPFTWDEICEKFRRYAAKVMDGKRAASIVGLVAGLETLTDCATLAEAVSGREHR